MQQLIKQKGFLEPTLPQKLGIPEIIAGKNVLIIAPTGSGKTEATMLPVFDLVSKNNLKPISVLYINPLRSLSRDLLERLVWWASKLDIDISVRHGDVGAKERAVQREMPPHVLITTPETLGAILPGKVMHEHLRNVKYVIIDEVHELVESKRGVQLSLLLERLAEISSFQRIGLSATVGSPELVAKFFKLDNIIHAELQKKYDIKVEAPRPTVEDKTVSDELLIGEETTARLRRLYELIKSHQSILIFTNTRETAEVLSSRLRSLDKELKQTVHHGSLSKEKRIKSEHEFKAQMLKSLICLAKGTRVLLQNGSWQHIESLNCSSPLIGLDKTLKLIPSYGRFVVNKDKKSVVNLKTAAGFEISCTPNHLFLTVDMSKGVCWKPLQSFSIGDPIAIIRKAGIGSDEADFLEQLPRHLYVKISKSKIGKVKTVLWNRNLTYKKLGEQLGVRHNRLRSFLSSYKAIRLDTLECITQVLNLALGDFLPDTFGSKNYPRYKIPKYVSSGFCGFLGFLLADGTVTKRNRSVRLFNKNLELLRAYAKPLQNDFGATSRIFCGKENVYVSTSYLTWLQNLLEKWGVPIGRKAKIVAVPDIIFRLPLAHRAAFLAGYFDGDGNYEYKNNKLVGLMFNTFSLRMADDLQKLLLGLGCIASKRLRPGQNGYVVSVLGGEHLRSVLKLCEFLKRPKFQPSQEGYCNQDVIPNIGAMLSKLRNESNSVYNRDTPEIMNLLNSDIYWDSVHDIVPDEKKEVFDIIDVTPSGCFVAEGFVTHNCTSSLELGIDIGSIDLVIQYLSPRQVTRLVQRIGRSGHRVGAVSEGIVMSGDEDLFEATVIANNAMRGRLEEVKVHNLATDVLASQIVGITLDEYEATDEKIYNIVKRAYPYNTLEKKDFLGILKFLDELRLVWLNPVKNGFLVKRRRQSWEYYFENLSTIPDTRQYRVISIIQHEPIGNLDEAFIAEHGLPGEKFVCSGRAWRIIQIDGTKVIVEPIEDIESAIPAWEGELIPVPYSIAQGVGELRKAVAEKKAGVDRPSLRIMEQIVEKHKETHTLPTHNNFLMENYKDFIIIHACCGSLVNDTLGRYIAAKLTQDTGVSVNIKTDPYRIMLQTIAKPEDAKKILMEAGDIEETLMKEVERSSMFKYRFLHVAKRFGVIARHARYDKINLNRLVKEYVNSPVYNEALREIVLEKMDIENARHVLEKLQKAEIKLVLAPGLSLLGSNGLTKQFAEVMKPRMPEKEIQLAFKRRLLATRVRLVCMNCTEYNLVLSVRSVENQPECTKCHSRLIAVTRRSFLSADKLVKKKTAKKELNAEEQKEFQNLRRSADLVIVYGRRAVEALAARGVGPQTAARILSMLHTNKEQFYNDILAAEKNFAKTRIYWN